MSAFDPSGHQRSYLILSGLESVIKELR